MSEHFCKVCHGYLWTTGGHTCPPELMCRFDDQDKHDRDWRGIYAHDPEIAAEKFAEEYDCENEYGILQQGDRCERVIEVRAIDGTISRWRITAESVPHYYAEEVENAE